MMKCRLYKYGGEINENLIQVNTADIKFCDLYDKIDLDKVSEKEKVQNIYDYIEKNNLKNTITLSDDRLVYVFNKLLCQDVFKEIGLNEWFIVYRFWNIYYDSGVPYIDLLIRFLNLSIGVNFTTGMVKDEEISELNTIAKRLREFDMAVPSFVKETVNKGVEAIGADKVLEEIKEVEATKSEIEQQIDDAIEALEIMAVEDKEEVYTREIRRLKLMKHTTKFKYGGELQTVIS